MRRFLNFLVVPIKLVLIPIVCLIGLIFALAGEEEIADDMCSVIFNPCFNNMGEPHRHGGFTPKTPFTERPVNEGTRAFIELKKQILRGNSDRKCYELDLLFPERRILGYSNKIEKENRREK